MTFIQTDKPIYKPGQKGKKAYKLLRSAVITASISSFNVLAL